MVLVADPPGMQPQQYHCRMERDTTSGTQDTLAAPPSTATPVPELLARYRTGEVIGRGGMGEVVSARDEQIGRTVAIKRMRARDTSPELVARFLREARVQGRLEHPAIVPVHELHDDGEEPFFVMKQLSGVTLASVIAGYGDAAKRFTRHELLRAFVDVCLAIEFAHTRGVLHRDLKPANIMLGDFGEVYVLDWGIARIAGEPAARASLQDIEMIEGAATVAGTVLGTPGYMSPEQIQGASDVDARSDVYALGCILFEILAGTALHPSGEAGITTALAGVDARPSVTAPDRDIAPELDAVCAKATATERDARFASARSLGDAVRRFLDGDRDLAMRKELARAELVRAREALAGHGSASRRDAIRAAARSLALDPHARESAELVGRLMIEEPTEFPPEVETELKDRELTDLHDYLARGGKIAAAGYALSVLMFYFVGIHTTWILVVLLAAGLAAPLTTYAFPRRYVIASGYFAMSIQVLAIVAISRATTVLLMAPCLAAIIAGAFALYPRLGSAWRLYAVFAAAVFVPWIGELAGLLPRTTFVENGAIVLHGAISHLHPTFTLVGLGVWCAIAPALSIGLARASALDHRRLHRKIHLQSWQLRQLVPDA